MTDLLRPQTPFPPMNRRAPLVPAGVLSSIPRGEPSPGQPDALTTEQGINVRLPGMNFAPPGATPVDEMGDGDLVAGAAAATSLLTVVVPGNQRFRMAAIGFAADDETALSFLSWSIGIGVTADPIPGYIDKPASVGSVQNLTDLVVLVGASLIIQVTARCSALAGTLTPGVPVTYRYICRVRGWFYTEKELA